MPDLLLSSALACDSVEAGADIVLAPLLCKLTFPDRGIFCSGERCAQYTIAHEYFSTPGAAAYRFLWPCLW